MVNNDQQSVALLECRSYQQRKLKESIDALLSGLSFSFPRGARVLLKPNLVTGKSKNGLACTDSMFVTAVAEWFLDNSAAVMVGDSPAFGSATHVMKICGMAGALDGLPVTLLNFKKSRVVKLDCGVSINMAADLFECDQLINLPKLKAHSQMLVSLAVKNFFGAVLGCRKALAHMRYGERDNLFVELLVDLLDVIPASVSLLDGIVAMHQEGPVNGQAFDAGVVGASRDPVALDTAILEVLGVQASLSPLWQECKRRGLPGANPELLSFPLQSPDDLAISGFVLPEGLDPVRFQFGRFVKNSLLKIVSNSAGEN